MSSHPRDISSHDLDVMLALTPHREALRELVDSGRERIGFFPAHNPRALEYPWVLTSLPAQPTGMRILDVGAGVNPLPLVLAQRGAHVVTMDNHPLQRDLGQRDEWNEWGFLDYSQLDTRITSLNVAYEESPDAMTFDCIYSVSVIEHLPCAVRKTWVRKFAAHLPAGGMLLLTIDLVPATNRLWNLSEGVVVEPAGAHGEISSLLDELGVAGFAVEDASIQRTIPDSRVDIGFIRAVRR
jgi:2-polyprenyl-3-methyl-5-hydroxy-6-metoxy-1,4-benzoquinol methylase